MNDWPADFITGRPLPEASHRMEKVVIILAAAVLGGVIGWRLGR